MMKFKEYHFGSDKESRYTLVAFEKPETRYTNAIIELTWTDAIQGGHYTLALSPTAQAEAERLGQIFETNGTFELSDFEIQHN